MATAELAQFIYEPGDAVAASGMEYFDTSQAIRGCAGDPHSWGIGCEFLYYTHHDLAARGVGPEIVWDEVMGSP